jgi:glycosyltransferase involved in cell wall biosynthesis
LIHKSANAEQLLSGSESRTESSPFLTIAIPHYKHRRYLEIVLQSVFAQSYQDFEILISDDCSPDDSNSVIPPLLKDSGRSFRYYAQSANLGYDGNVRFCLSAARGRYVFLLGNDDALAGPDVLERVANMLKDLDFPEVAFTSFGVWNSEQVVPRALSTRILGHGPAVALTHFRSFSFVSGLIYDQKLALANETDRWDSSIYYQIFIACRIMAAGGRLGSLAISAISKDVRVADHMVPNYATKWANEAWSLQNRHTGLDSVVRVTADAVRPFVAINERSAVLRSILVRMFASSYSFWLVEYRRVSNWSFSAGIARAMWPGKLLREYKVDWGLTLKDRIHIWCVYLFTTIAGLLAPVSLLRAISSRLANTLRRKQQSRPAAVEIV